MDGLKHLLFRVIPLITLICFVCFGITHAFQQQDETPITYLETNYYDKSNGFEIIENPTEEQKEADSTLKVYEFNFTEYRNNINQNILKNSINHTLDLQAYENTLTKFNQIWNDGYQFGDGVQTIINAVILVINSIIFPINIILVPIRIISGILLTGISLIGININNGQIICPMLNFLTTQLAIPFINPTINVDTNTSINNTEWTFLTTNLQLNNSIWREDTYFFFESNDTKYIGIAQQNNKLYYIYLDNNNTDHRELVYENNQWNNQNYKNIKILDKNTLTNQEVENISAFLYKNTIDTTLLNTTWQWNNNPTFTTEDIRPNINFTSNNQNFDILRFGNVSNDNIIIYAVNNPESLTMIYQNQTWTNNNYKTFTISANNEISHELTNQLLSVFNQNATQIT